MGDEQKIISLFKEFKDIQKIIEDADIDVGIKNMSMRNMIKLMKFIQIS
jgi:hypothetical protein